MLIVCPLVLFILAFALCVHRFAASDYPIGIFKKLSFVMPYLLYSYLFVYTCVHHDFHITWFPCRLILYRWVSLLDQELFPRPEHMSSCFRFNDTFNNISAISWLSALLVKRTTDLSPIEM
jgi:hypothetical protein